MSVDWPICKLSDFINVKHGFAFKGEYFKNEKTKDFLVTPGNFSIGGGFKADKFKYYDGPVSEEYILSEGDLVVTMTDLSKQADTLGYSALIPALSKHRLLHNQRVGLVEFKNDELDKTYLYFLLKSKEYRDHVIGGITGTTVKHTSPKKILSFEFKKPPKKVQMSIGERLISLEEKIDLNRQTNQTVELIAQAIFKSWFVDFEPTRAKVAARQAGQDPERAAMAAISGKALEELDQLSSEQLEQLKTTAALFPDEMVDSELGEVPEGWGKSCLGDFVKFANGKSIKSSKEGKYPVYGANGVIGRTENTKFSNAVIVGRVGAYCGAVLYSLGDFWASDNTIVASPSKHDEMLPYIFYQLQILNLNQYAGGAAQPLLNQTTLKSIEVVFPSIELAVQYSGLVQRFFEQTTSCFIESKNLEDIRGSLLPKLLSGELEIPSKKTEVA